jgi:hypothetical protein
LQTEFVWEDSKHTLTAAHSGISGALQNILAFEGAIAKPVSAVASIFAYECEHHLAHKSAAFDAICEMVFSVFLQERRKVDTTLDDQKRFMTEKKRGEDLRLLKLDLYSLKLDKYTLGEDLYSLKLDAYTLGMDKYTLGMAVRGAASAAARTKHHVYHEAEVWAQVAKTSHGLGVTSTSYTWTTPTERMPIAT